MKVCTKCKEEKEVNDINFYKHPGCKDGYNSCCIKCTNKTTKKYYLNNKEKVRLIGKEYRTKNKTKVKICSKFSTLKRKYGITKEQFNLLINKQNNSCAICKDIFTEENYACVDHIEENNKIIIRGLLCDSCNVALGYFKENLKIVKDASLYMEKIPEFIIG